LGSHNDQSANPEGRFADPLAASHVLREAGGEWVGLVDLIAARKDHGPGTKRGDMLQIILIQVKGGTAPMPTAEDAKRLTAVAKRIHSRHILLTTW
jgi:hypothetical protein